MCWKNFTHTNSFVYRPKPQLIPEGLLNPIRMPEGLLNPMRMPEGLLNPMRMPEDLLTPLLLPEDLLNPLPMPEDLLEPPADARGPAEPPADARGPADPAAAARGPAEPPVDARAPADPAVKLAPGAFVRVLVLPANGRRDQGKVYMAVVTKMLDGGKLRVTFLRNKPGQKHFTFPQAEDESTITLADVEEVMAEPKFDRRGQIFFDKRGHPGSQALKRKIKSHKQKNFLHFLFLFLFFFLSSFLFFLYLVFNVVFNRSRLYSFCDIIFSLLCD